MGMFFYMWFKSTKGIYGNTPETDPWERAQCKINGYVKGQVNLKYVVSLSNNYYVMIVGTFGVAVLYFVVNYPGEVNISPPTVQVL